MNLNKIGKFICNSNIIDEIHYCLNEVLKQKLKNDFKTENIGENVSLAVTRNYYAIFSSDNTNYMIGCINKKDNTLYTIEKSWDFDVMYKLFIAKTYLNCNTSYVYGE